MTRKAEEPQEPELEGQPGEMRRWLETRIWPYIPPDRLGGPPITRAEKAAYLGYGPEEDEEPDADPTTDGKR